MAKNVKVVAKPGESSDSLIRRFKKEVLRSYVLDDVKRHQYHMSKKELLQYKRDMLARHTKNKKYR